MMQSSDSFDFVENSKGPILCLLGFAFMAAIISSPWFPLDATQKVRAMLILIPVQLIVSVASIIVFGPKDKVPSTPISVIARNSSFLASAGLTIVSIWILWLTVQFAGSAITQSISPRTLASIVRGSFFALLLAVGFAGVGFLVRSVMSSVYRYSNLIIGALLFLTPVSFLVPALKSALIPAVSMLATIVPIAIYLRLFKHTTSS